MNNLYDFDGTIYDGDSTLDFYFFCLHKKKSLIKYFPIQFFYFVMYKLKIVSKKRFKEKFFMFLKSIPNIDTFIELFWLQNKYKIKKWYLEVKEKTDIIISASPSFLLNPVLEPLKVKAIIATEVDKISGKFLSENCFGTEKINRLYKKYPKIKINNFYTDSLNDLPLINISQNSYIIKKNNISIYEEKDNKFLANEIVNYLVVGFLTMFITIAVYWFCTRIFFDNQSTFGIQVSNFISWLIAVFFAYFANKKYVFKSDIGFKLVEMFNFIASRVLTLLLDMVLMYILVKYTVCNDILIKVFVQVVVVLLNYVISKYIIFKK